MMSKCYTLHCAKTRVLFQQHDCFQSKNMPSKSPPSYKIYRFVEGWRWIQGSWPSGCNDQTTVAIRKSTAGFKWRAARLTLLSSKPIESWSQVSWLQVSDSCHVEWYPVLYLYTFVFFLEGIFWSVRFVCFSLQQDGQDLVAGDSIYIVHRKTLIEHHSVFEIWTKMFKCNSLGFRRIDIFLSIHGCTLSVSRHRCQDTASHWFTFGMRIAAVPKLQNADQKSCFLIVL